MTVRKLCLLIPSLQAGGMERVMSELAWHFSLKHDIELHLVLYGITREVFYPVPVELNIHKPTFKFSNRFRALFTIRTILYLRKTVKKVNPVSILSFGEYWNSFVLITLLGLNYPIFVSDRCQPDKSLGKLHDWLRKILYPKAEGIIVQTQMAGNIFRRSINNRNIIVIGNPIKEMKLKEDIERENIVLMVGRLIRTKHQDKLIEMFIRISKPGWKLVIVGYDHLKQNNSEELRRIIADNNAEDKVFLVGKQADVETYYLKSKVFAFTSSSEGFPNVIGEAMSARLPVIAFDCIAGPSEMIKDSENGFLIPLFNFDQFREKLEVLMDNEELRTTFGNKAREDIKRFSIGEIGDQYFKLLIK